VRNSQWSCHDPYFDLDVETDDDDDDDSSWDISPTLYVFFLRIGDSIDLRENSDKPLGFWVPRFQTNSYESWYILPNYE